MGSVMIGLITFACAFGGALIGLFLASVLPEHHRSKESKDAIKMGAGFIATLTALVLGLLITSAKDSFDQMSNAMAEGGARVILLDRALAHYGPETKSIRDELRGSVATGIDVIWGKGKEQTAKVRAFEATPGMETVQSELRKLVPQNDIQRSFRSQAIDLSNELLQTRWQTIEQAQITLPTPFFVVLLFWLAALFASIGLLASRNTTVFVVLFVCAISISGAVFLIHEMNRPLDGMIRVSKKPLLKALEHIGK